MTAHLQRTVRTPDGRTLAVEEAGDPDGRPVLVHLGTPNSRHLYEPSAVDAAARGLRLISYDRPGYGGSTSQPGRTVASCAADVRAICAGLGISRAASWGISGGGPHVLACAALLPAQADGLDWFEGMGQANVDDFRLLEADEAAARIKLEADREEMLAASAAEQAGMMASLLTPADAVVLKDDLAEYLLYTAREGLAPGGEGWWEDGVAFARPWGFELSDITIPVLVMQGRQDQFVPFGHGQWLAAHVPGAQARLLEDDGHLTLLVNRIGEVHTWLAERL